MTEAERNAIIEQCAQVARSFNGASNSPANMPFVEAGLMLEVFKRDAAIAAAIRALASDPVAKNFTEPVSIASANFLYDKAKHLYEELSEAKRENATIRNERNALIEQCAGVADGAADLLAWRWKTKTSEWVDVDPLVGAKIDEARRIASDIRALASDSVKAADAWLDEMVQPGSTREVGSLFKKMTLDTPAEDRAARLWRQAYIGEIDTDELHAAAEFIERQEKSLNMAVKALEIIAGKQQGIDSLMSNADVAKFTLDRIKELP